MTSNFYIDDDKRNSNKECRVLLFVREKGTTIKIDTGLRLEVKYWDRKKQKVKRNFIGSPEQNRFLAKFKDAQMQKFLDLKTKHPNLDFKSIKQLFLQSKEQEKQSDLLVVFEQFIKSRKSTLSVGTFKKYNTLLSHLKKFSKTKKIKLNFETLDYNVFDKLQNYFISLGHSNNTVFKHIQNFKTFLNWAVEREYTENLKFQRYKQVQQSRPENIALTKEDLVKIITCEGLSPKLQKTRDLFLFMVYTGQRYSDAAKFDYNDVKNGVWTFIQQKTKSKMNIPLSDSALNIIKKYNYTLPMISNQKLNNNLKLLGELAGLNDIVTITKYSGTKAIEETYPKFMFLTTHVARRTFVSLASYHGVNQQVVKAMTGHRADRMIDQYFRKDDKQTLDAINDIFNN